MQQQCAWIQCSMSLAHARRDAGAGGGRQGYARAGQTARARDNLRWGADYLLRTISRPASGASRYQDFYIAYQACPPCPSCNPVLASRKDLKPQSASGAQGQSAPALFLATQVAQLRGVPAVLTRDVWVGQVGNYTLERASWQRPEDMRTRRPVYYVATKNGAHPLPRPSPMCRQPCVMPSAVLVARSVMNQGRLGRLRQAALSGRLCETRKQAPRRDVADLVHGRVDVLVSTLLLSVPDVRGAS